MNAIETITASAKPPTVEMNTVPIELHNAISRLVKQNPPQRAGWKKGVIGIFRHDRPAEFDEDKIRNLPTFQTWRKSAVGAKLKYGKGEFIKGRGNDEERLMRRLYSHQPKSDLKKRKRYYCPIEGCGKQQNWRCRPFCWEHGKPAEESRPDSDVLFGSTRWSSHPGNLTFHKIVQSKTLLYEAAKTKPEKKSITLSIVLEMKEQLHLRFMKEDNTTGVWIEVTDNEIVRRKVIDAFGHLRRKKKDQERM